MAWMDAGFITLTDLYVAYRKAKVDMFYERDHATAFSFAEFEQSLGENLQALFEILNSPEPTWQISPGFVGTYSYVPKSLDRDPNSPTTSAALQFVTSEPNSAWQFQSQQSKHLAKFRIVGRHPVAFHVVSALWILKVGHLYDAVLGECAYGSRLRRAHADEEGMPPPSQTSIGSFKAYSYGFREWRQNGIDAIRLALKQEKSVIAVTADLRRFYHEVSPRYLLNAQYLEEFGIDLSIDQRRFTELLIEAFHTWGANTPEHKDLPIRGLPVGLSAPRVIANALLAGFDRAVERHLSPLYYGRYVDDVLLVIDSSKIKITSAESVWALIAERLDGLVVPGKDGVEDAYWVKLPYSEDSSLRFVGDKQKVFALAGSSGESLLNSISRTIAQRSSDWRLLPDLPGDASDLTNDFVTAGQDATEEVDNLRKSDGISVRRLAFALRLRNFESVQRDLKPDQWRSHREQFYRLAMDHVLTVPGLFAYGPYLSRLVGLAVACGDWAEAGEFVQRIRKLFFDVLKTANVEFDKFEQALISTLDLCLEAAVKALGITSVDKESFSSFLATFQEDFVYDPPSIEKCIELARALFAADLAREAFREAWLDGEHNSPPSIKKEWLVSLPPEVLSKFRLKDAQSFLKGLGIWKGKPVPRAVAFPTRPFNPAEIALLEQACLSDSELFRKLVRAVRGVEIAIKGNHHKGNTKTNPEVIVVPNHASPDSPYVAVPCFKTKDESWVASVAGTADPDPDRYFRLNKLVNDVLLERVRVQYLVLPELALPRRWFNRLAHKLSHSGVSLIAGLEYLHHQPPKAAMASLAGTATGYVANQVRASLVTDVLGYPAHVIYVQEKVRPALDEEKNLRSIAGKLMVPKGNVRKPIIRHGGFHFGVLICSELTNIDLRQPFRGRVDALFVPEWNKDINSFISLVEASALDIHCFVVQVNNRTYGDCRIRAPYREPFKRDVTRVMGGETDYFVVGKIDINGLRAFQSNFRSPSEGLYKPMPDGFEIDPSRRVRPAP